jgi:hypothetical protein
MLQDFIYMGTGPAWFARLLLELGEILASQAHMNAQSRPAWQTTVETVLQRMLYSMYKSKRSKQVKKIKIKSPKAQIILCEIKTNVVFPPKSYRNFLLVAGLACIMQSD